MAENVAEQMLRILSGHRSWTRAQLMSITGRRCLLGARLRSKGDLCFLPMGTNIAHLNHDPYMKLLARIIREQFPERVICDADAVVKQVIYFNDHPGTRFTDVRLVLEKAAAEWEEGKENGNG